MFWIFNGKDIKSKIDSICCCWLATIVDSQLTFLSLLPEWHHLIEFSLYQPVSLLLVQPFARWESLLYPCEWAVNHHPHKSIHLNSLPVNYHPMCACWPYLFTVPPSTDSIIVMPNGNSAEGTEKCSDLNFKDVRQAPFKLSPGQKHLAKTRWKTDNDETVSHTCCLITMCYKQIIHTHHPWGEKEIQQEKKKYYSLPHYLLVQCENITVDSDTSKNKIARVLGFQIRYQFI